MNETAPPTHPFPRSIEAFEETLERARAAKISAFAVITVDPNGIVTWKWHFGARPQTDLIGGLSCMQHVIISNAMQPPQLQQPMPLPEAPSSKEIN